MELTVGVYKEFEAKMMLDGSSNGDHGMTSSSPRLVTKLIHISWQQNQGESSLLKRTFEFSQTKSACD